MEKERGILEQMLDKRDEWAARQPSFGAQLQALVREAAKDIHNTAHEVFFGQQDGPGEAGTPLVPTQAMVTKSLGTVHGYSAMLEDAASRGVQQESKEIER